MSKKINVIIKTMNSNEIGVLIFYSLLTWFIGPQVSDKLLKKNENRKEIGMCLGFAISMFLYFKYGKNIIEGKSKSY